LKDLNDRSKLFTSTQKFQRPILDKFKSYLDKTSFLNTSVFYSGSSNNPDSKKKLNEIKIKIKQAEVLIDTTKFEIENLNQREKDLKLEMKSLEYDLAIQKKFTNYSLFFSIKVILWIAIFLLILFLIYRRLGLI
jgi:hypothetical protein